MTADTDRHERIEAREVAPLHPEVVKWATDAVASARHFHARGGCTAEALADFERLLEFVRGVR